MTGSRLSGIQVEDIAAALLTNDGYHVVQAHARQTSRLKGGEIHTTRKHDLLMGRFDQLAFKYEHCRRIQTFRGNQLEHKKQQASGPTPTYCIDELWKWASDNSGFKVWWNTDQGWREKDPVRVNDPHAVLARADQSMDDEVHP